MARNMGNSGTFPVPVVMWAPNIILAVLVSIFIHRTAHEKQLLPAFMHNSFDASITWSINVINWLYQKLSPGSHSLSSVSTTGTVKRSAPLKKKRLRGNVSSRIFHFPECDYYYSKNCSIEFKDVKVALQAGFEPCQFCNTILEKKLEDET